MLIPTQKSFLVEYIRLIHLQTQFLPKTSKKRNSRQKFAKHEKIFEK